MRYAIIADHAILTLKLVKIKRHILLRLLQIIAISKEYYIDKSYDTYQLVIFIVFTVNEYYCEYHTPPSIWSIIIA